MSWVYILSNEEQQKGILKIGKTQHHPEARARDLSRQTGVLGRFTVEWSARVPNMDIAEKLLHNAFKDFRVERRKEHFKLEKEVAIEKATDLLKIHFGLDELEIHPIKKLVAKTEIWWNSLSIKWWFIFKDNLPNYIFYAAIDNYRDIVSDEDVYEEMTLENKRNVADKLEIDLSSEEPDECFYDNIIEILFELLMTNSNWFYKILELSSKIDVPSNEEIQKLWNIEKLVISESDFEVLEPFQKLTTLEVSIHYDRIDSFKYLGKLQNLKSLTIHGYNLGETIHYRDYQRQLQSIAISLNTFESLEFVIFKMWVLQQFTNKASDIISDFTDALGFRNEYAHISPQLTLFGEIQVTLRYERYFTLRSGSLF